MSAEEWALVSIAAQPGVDSAPGPAPGPAIGPGVADASPTIAGAAASLTPPILTSFGDTLLPRPSVATPRRIQQMMMEGYTTSSYGDGFADVYDEWYERISDVDQTVSLIAELADGGPVLELGVGTGRLAIPLAQHGVRVTGIDTSEAMLARLRAKPGGESVIATIGDMTAPFGGGPFSVVFVAYNTLFAVDDDDELQRCLANVTDALRNGGRFVVEAFVPVAPEVAASVEVKTVTADRVVLSVSQFDPQEQRAHGQFVEFTEAGGVRLRPWAVRYWTPQQLDEYAAAAGLIVENRYESWDRRAFTGQSVRHVTIYRRDESCPGRLSRETMDDSQTS